MQQILLQTCIVCCGTIQKSSKDNLLYAQKKDDNCVNIFHKHNYCITAYISALYKTYCFAFQKRRFCTVKAAVLQRKTYAFGKRKKKHWFSVKIFQRLWEGEMGELNDRTKKVGARIAHAPTIVPNTYVQFIGCRKAMPRTPANLFIASQPSCRSQCKRPLEGLSARPTNAHR